MEAFNIVQVYPDQYLRQLQTEQYYVGKVNKKSTSSVMKLLAAYPVSQYLKRVKPLKQQQNNEILLCKKDQQEQINSIRETLGQLLLETKIAPLPKEPCPLKQKLPQWEKLWPCSFRNDLEIINHTPEQVNFIQKLFKDNQFNIHLFSKQLRVLMKFAGKCKENSVLHGVILLLQEWPKTQEFNAEVEVPKGLSKLQQLQLQCTDKYYYLTGLRMLIRGQICNMCAMALVHSRLDRLYHTGQDLQRVKKICYERSLNHNYTLFKVGQ